MSTTVATIDVVNPYTEEIIGSVPACGPDDVDRAVAAARAAFPAWAATPPAERAGYLAAIAEQLSERGDELAATISAELGMPIGLSRLIQVGLPTMTFASMPALLEDLQGEEIGNSLIVREPLGVVAAITPWNYPLHQIAAKVAPALAAGCTVVLKPSELTPLCAVAFGEICATVGLPAGVFNLVTGHGEIVGEALTGHPDVDYVSFTGSEGIGRRIGEVTGRNLVPSALELGGKSACIVLDDADLALAVTSCVTRCMLNSGQTCIALTRLLVPRERLAEAEAIAVAVAQAHVLGDPFDPATQMGRSSRPRSATGSTSTSAGPSLGGARLVTGGTRHRASAATSCRRRSSPTSAATCPSPRRRSSGRCSRSWPTTARRTRSASPTTPATGSRAPSGRATRTARCASPAASAPGRSTSTAAAFNPCAPFGGVDASGHGRELGAHGLAEFSYLKSIQR